MDDEEVVKARSEDAQKSDAEIATSKRKGYGRITSQSASLDAANSFQTDGNASFPKPSVAARKSSVRRESSDDSSGKKKKKIASKSSGSTTKPKRPLTAYNLFFRERRREILKSTHRSSPDREGEAQLDDEASTPMLDYRYTRTGKRLHRKTHGLIGFVDLVKIVGAQWKGLDEEGRAPFVSQAKREKEKYDKEMDAYKKRVSGEGQSPRSSVDSDLSVDSRSDSFQEENVAKRPSEDQDKVAGHPSRHKRRDSGIRCADEPAQVVTPHSSFKSSGGAVSNASASSSSPLHIPDLGIGQTRQETVVQREEDPNVALFGATRSFGSEAAQNSSVSLSMMHPQVTPQRQHHQHAYPAMRSQNPVVPRTASWNTDQGRFYRSLPAGLPQGMAGMRTSSPSSHSDPTPLSLNSEQHRNFSVGHRGSWAGPSAYPSIHQSLIHRASHAAGSSLPPTMPRHRTEAMREPTTDMDPVPLGQRSVSVPNVPGFLPQRLRRPHGVAVERSHSYTEWEGRNQGLVASVPAPAAMNGPDPSLFDKELLDYLIEMKEPPGPK